MRARTPPRALPDLVDDGRVGVYAHLPFCERVCPYCDFAVVAARTLPAEVEARYVEALLRELEARQSAFADRGLASLYFGGGTPSLFRPSSIARLVGAVGAAFSSAHGDPVETTLELNPSTVEQGRLPDFRAAGIDRLSIGVQSFQDRLLKQLGRAHRAPVVWETLRTAREAGFENVSLDLIFAVPGQTLEELERDLAALITFGPEHVSTYELTFEPGTPFGRAVERGRMSRFDEDRAVDMIEAIEARLGSAAFQRYEISTYARAGRRARHNVRYWQRQAVLAIGMGAHSFEPRTADHPHGRRRANPRTLDAWLQAVERDPERAGEEETTSTATARGEAIFLALRQREGLAGARFLAEFGHPPRHFFGPEIDLGLTRGWLEEGATGPGDLRLTAAGRLVADSVAAMFVESAEPAATFEGPGN